MPRPLQSSSGQGNAEKAPVADADGFRGQGVERRSERANAVAQNTCKNKHLAPVYCNDEAGTEPSADTGTDVGSGSSANTSTGTPSKREIVKVSMGEQLFYYHSDHLGSTGYVTRENGKLHEHVQYFPFGETWVQQGGNTEKSPYLFTSKELDEETGLYYFGSRYYDPRTSLWASADVVLSDYLDGRRRGGVFMPGHLGLYTYVQNNPLLFIDPDGMAELVFVYSAKREDLSDHTISLINQAADTAKIDKLYITETKRTVESQAETMYKNLEKKATASNLYKDAGQAVEKSYRDTKAAGKGKDDILKSMTDKIKEVGAGNVSAHMGDFSKKQAVDIADNLLPKDKKGAFSDALNELKKDGKVSKYLGPPADPAHHIEIPQPQPKVSE